MPWIELTKRKKIGGKICKPGTRINWPYQAARALCGSGAAFWVDGPKKRAPEPEQNDPVEDQNPQDPGDPVPDDPEREEEPADRPEEKDTAGLPSPEEFLDLSAKEQREIMRDLGLDGEADMRSSQKMAIVYGAYFEG